MAAQESRGQRKITSRAEDATPSWRRRSRRGADGAITLMFNCGGACFVIDVVIQNDDVGENEVGHREPLDHLGNDQRADVLVRARCDDCRTAPIHSPTCTIVMPPFAWTTTAAAMGIEEILTAPRSPWQNAYAERLIGSIHRECLDQSSSSTNADSAAP